MTWAEDVPERRPCRFVGDRLARVSSAGPPALPAKVIGWPLLTVRPKDGPMNEQPSILPPSPEEAERLALEAAVAEARADPRPGILHEDVRQEMLAETGDLSRRR